MTQNKAIRRVLSLAQSEIGYHEKASNANLQCVILSINNPGISLPPYSKNCVDGW